jgi:PAS domain S-box-containing protein
VLITDTDDRIVWVNAAFTRTTGWVLDEVRGQRPAALLCAPDGAGAYPSPARAQAGRGAGAVDRDTELPLRRRSGTTYWAAIAVQAVGDERGEVTHHLHLHTEVTARLAAEQRAADSQRWLQLAGSVYGLGLWQVSLPGGPMIWDFNLKQLFGLAQDEATPSAAELLDRYVLAEDRARVRRAMQDLPPPGTHSEVEFRIRRRDGELRNVVSRQASLDGERGQPAARMIGAVLDVTEARSTTLQLRDALRRLRLAAEASGIGAWERDLLSGEGNWDPTMFTLLGRLPAERAPSRAETLLMVHPDDRASVAIAWQRMATERRPVEYEYRIIRPDGSVVNIITRAVVEHDADGTPLRALGTAIDITDLRRAERERDELARRMELVADAVGLGIWEWEPQARRSRWNDRMYALYGHTRDSFRDRVWTDELHPDDRERAARTFREAERRGTPFEIEFRVLDPDGTVRWLASRGRGETDADGRVVRVHGVNWDITDRVRIEQAARAAERTARDLLERMLLATSATGLGIWEHDVRGDDLVWDRQLYRLFGREPGGTAPGAIWRAAVHRDDLPRLDALVDDAVRSGRKYEAEFRVELPDGTLRWLASRGLLREGAPGRVLLGVTWDITERRVAESALRAKETAERASAAKTEFLSRMSHELRTPLNAILGFTQLLELDARQPLTGEQRERVGHIRQAGWHLLTLINEVLDLSRIEAGAARIEIGPVALAPALDECLTLIATEAGRRRLRVGLEVAPGLAPAVLADRTRLKQILLNLLSNAVKYNRDGGRIDLVALQATDGWTTIAVRDGGLGISAEKMDKLFQPFNRLGLESASIEGTGIGLTIALKLAEQMGGRLEASSEPGVGSEFRLTLRAATAA